MQLEKKNKYNKFNYEDTQQIINEIKITQDELYSLENEWQSLEEEKLTKEL